MKSRLRFVFPMFGCFALLIILVSFLFAQTTGDACSRSNVAGFVGGGNQHVPANARGVLFFSSKYVAVDVGDFSIVHFPSASPFKDGVRARPRIVPSRGRRSETGGGFYYIIPEKGLEPGATYQFNFAGAGSRGSLLERVILTVDES